MRAAWGIEWISVRRGCQQPNSSCVHVGHVSPAQPCSLWIICVSTNPVQSCQLAFGDDPASGPHGIQRHMFAHHLLSELQRQARPSRYALVHQGHSNPKANTGKLHHSHRVQCVAYSEHVSVEHQKHLIKHTNSGFVSISGTAPPDFWSVNELTTTTCWRVEKLFYY